MTDTLVLWLRIVTLLSAIACTSFPVLYAFLDWNETFLGRVLMFRAVTLAFAIDLSLLFLFWTPTNIYLIFWINVIVFGLVGISSSLLTVMLWRLNYKKNWFKETNNNILRRKHGTGLPDQQQDV